MGDAPTRRSWHPDQAQTGASLRSASGGIKPAPSTWGASCLFSSHFPKAHRPSKMVITKRRAELKYKPPDTHTLTHPKPPSTMQARQALRYDMDPTFKRELQGSRNPQA